MMLALTIGTEYYLVLSALLFTIGAGGLLVRRNPLIMFMCIELMLNAANLAFISFGKEMGDLGGQLSVLFVLVVAAAEVVIGLAIVVAVMRRRPKASIDEISVLRGKLWTVSLSSYPLSHYLVSCFSSFLVDAWESQVLVG